MGGRGATRASTGGLKGSAITSYKSALPAPRWHPLCPNQALSKDMHKREPGQAGDIVTLLKHFLIPTHPYPELHATEQIAGQRSCNLA